GEQGAEKAERGGCEARPRVQQTHERSRQTPRLLLSMLRGSSSHLTSSHIASFDASTRAQLRNALGLFLMAVCMSEPVLQAYADVVGHERGVTPEDKFAVTQMIQSELAASMTRH